MRRFAFSMRHVAASFFFAAIGIPVCDGRPAQDRPEQVTPHWVWMTVDGEPAKTVYFRKEVSSEGVGTARLYAACDDRMTVYVDGKAVIEHGTWETPVFLDISDQMDLDSPQKDHLIAVEVENGKGAGGLLLRLDLESGWRDATSVVTDTSWKASTAPARGWKSLKFDDSKWQRPEIVAELGGGPWGEKINAESLAAVGRLREPTATPVESLKVAKGFNVELLYSVPKGQQGSWVNMCTDPKGRLIVSDQYGSLYRVTLPSISEGELMVEPINVDIGEAQGLLWAFDSLYVSVNKGKTYHGGLYRVRDTDGDDQLDSVETLRLLDGSGEHGPHAVLPHPDGKSLVIICGNRTALTEIDTSRVPTQPDEDQLLPRVQGKFMRGVRAPGGYICRIDPDGKSWELLASGFRNEFDAAYDLNGELFTYDADMEWDINTPWYRPTRICHVVSGAEYGWRSGGGKWPVYYEDSVPPVVNVGPGSPTGVTFGYGAKFPEKYQQALFAADWSYGKLYAVHLEPNGATYSGKLEEFITGIPLPLTDVVINPLDGAMYFLIGGRRVQSGLYRVTWTGSERQPVAGVPELTAAQQKRRELEELHSQYGAGIVDRVWDSLGSEDRFIRYAARIALERRPPEEWEARALAETDPQTSLTALLAQARMHQRPEKGEEPDIDTPVPDWESLDDSAIDADRRNLRDAILRSVDRLDWDRLTVQQQLLLTRVVSLTFLRVAPPNNAQRMAGIRKLVSAFPTDSQELNAELANLLVYAQAPAAAKLLVRELVESPTQEEQIGYAKTLRHLRTGWTPELRETYFKWFTRAGAYSGGASFRLFVDNIKADAVSLLSAEEMESLEDILNAPPVDPSLAYTAEPREFVRKWAMNELVPLVESGLHGRDFDAGRKLFGAASCFACHRFDNQGGAVGPDLTILSGRFSARDLLESIVEPSKQVSDQYAAVTILTFDGKIHTGRIVNLAGDSIRLQTDMLKPGSLVGIDRKQIDEMTPATVSMMPEGLLNTLSEEEVLDLMAYLLSRGDRGNAMFESR